MLATPTPIVHGKRRLNGARRRLATPAHAGGIAVVNTSIRITYNEELRRLADHLATIDRPGGFVTSGAFTGPLPRVDVEGLGTLAFPLPESQAADLSSIAEAAPFGRGEDTLYDPTVRRTRQLSPDRFRVGGRTWDATMEELVNSVRDGLGLMETPFRAELYKLLLYQPGDFFAPHRDTEKTEGMFGTLVVALPAFHEGGHLCVRHRDREEIVSLTPDDVSEIRYAAFYADCEHEVLPVTRGSRLCLVYNLVLTKPASGSTRAPGIPDHEDAVDAIAEELTDWQRNQHVATKIVWLLDHEYTPAGLSFQGLKHVDAARSAVLCRAAERAGCAVYLGIVHIRESGPAMVEYSDYRRGRRYGHDPGDGLAEEYEIVEVSDREHSISDWVAPKGEPIEFGVVPISEGEILPVGALDDVPPDEERIEEATGNEGASFERAYRRAALLLWDADRTAEVLLRVGTAAAAADLARSLRRADLNDAAARDRLLASARAVVEDWSDAGLPSWRNRRQGSGLAELLGVLTQLDDARLIETGIESIVVDMFEPGINPPLVDCLRQLKPAVRRRLAGKVVSRNAGTGAADCIDLLHRLVGGQEDPSVGMFVADQFVRALPRSTPDQPDWAWRYPAHPRPTPLSGNHLADLFDALRILKAQPLTDSALAWVRDHPEMVSPDVLLMDALKAIRNRIRRGTDRDSAYAGLWTVATRFHLARSSERPSEPTDWALPVKKGCRCAECQRLLEFAVDPAAQERRFPLRAERRYHLQQRIQMDQMDISHVTEEKGRPYSLVCTKTRGSYQRRLQEYRQDIARMTWLEKHAPADTEDLPGRLADAIARSRG